MRTKPAALALLGLLGCAPAGLHECRIPGVDEPLRCGTLEVFEDREARRGRTIPLNVVVIPARGPTVRPDPLFDLSGGPGLASTEGAGFYAGEGAAYRRERDVVLVDQRGTGKSNPLTCDLATDDPNPRGILDEMYPPTAVAACHASLTSRANLGLYTTPIAMDDLDDVRAWLGYDRIDLFGLSYGTRAAMTYMSRHPDHVRSAILVGVAPPGMNIPLHHAADAQRAMDLLLQDCAADAACSGAFPKARAELDDLMAALEREPAKVEHVVPGKGGKLHLTLRREIVAEKLRFLLYSASTARRIPLVVHRALAGDYEPFLALALGDEGGPSGIADGMYLSVTCPEDTRRIDPAEARALNSGTFVGDYRVFQQTRACSMWPEAQLPAGYFDPFFTKAPVLIFSGRLDPVTAPHWAEEIAARLPHARNVMLHGAGHGPGGLSHTECLDGIILRFLDAGAVEALDKACVESMAPPPFSLVP
ncbi:MAG: alpha/beta fold hydrolase [Acidobacteria bacterium]|nr:alpha/beta fold hydrolase [Acidobacteriota bacterium]